MPTRHGPSAPESGVPHRLSRRSFLRIEALGLGSGWPQFGSAVAKLQGPVDPSVPPFVSLGYTCTHGPYNEPGPGFLGPSLAPFRAMGKTRDDMLLRGLSVARLADRKTLLKSFDSPRLFLGEPQVSAYSAFVSRKERTCNQHEEPSSARRAWGPPR